MCYRIAYFPDRIELLQVRQQIGGMGFTGVGVMQKLNHFYQRAKVDCLQDRPDVPGQKQTALRQLLQRVDPLRRVDLVQIGLVACVICL